MWFVVGSAAARAGFGVPGFELDFVDRNGAVCRASLLSCSDVRFEDVRPVRSFRWPRDTDHFPGWWWWSTTSRHVGFESWLERDHLMLLDFDPAVVAVASQPFWLHWRGERRDRRHAPDFFARLADGTGVVIDVRADDRIELADAEAFETTAQACAAAGWRFRRVGLIDPALAVNVRWLSRYRHPRCAGPAETVGRLRQVFAEPACLSTGVAEVGDGLTVLPAVFHLMWHQVLVADLASAPLGPSSMVRLGGDAR